MNEIPPHTVNSDTEIENLTDTKLERVTGDSLQTDMLSGTVYLEGALRSDIGAARQRNEDSCLLYTFGSDGQTTLPSFGLYIVADGMGGYEGGERASRVASRVAAHDLLQHIYLPMLHGGADLNRDYVEQHMRDAVLAAHEAIRQGDASHNGGTTLTIALVLDRQLFLGHVGDSRAYWLVDGDLQVLTTDHSLVQRLQDSGRLTPEEAESFAYRNVLLRALGQEEDLAVDVSARPLPRLGKLLLCSDGLCGVVSDPEIRQIMNQELPPDKIARQLISAALAAGGWDNISAIVVEFAA